MPSLREYVYFARFASDVRVLQIRLHDSSKVDNSSETKCQAQRNLNSLRNLCDRYRRSCHGNRNGICIALTFGTHFHDHHPAHLQLPFSHLLNPSANITFYVMLFSVASYHGYATT